MMKHEKIKQMIFMKVLEDENALFHLLSMNHLKIFAKKVDFGNACHPILGF